MHGIKKKVWGPWVISHVFFTLKSHKNMVNVHLAAIDPETGNEVTEMVQMTTKEYCDLNSSLPEVLFTKASTCVHGVALEIHRCEECAKDYYK